MSACEHVMALTIHAATQADLPWLAQAEQAAQITPWTLGNLRDSLHAGHHIFIAHSDDVPCAYAVLGQALDECELLTIGVLPAQQGRGIGAALLAHVHAHAHAQGARRMFLEVRAGNQPALALYRRAGFAEIGARRGYYPSAALGGAREDACVMAREWADDVRNELTIEVGKT
jgi:[ribosomal protein S18]-alanine N-acetyltransferase